MTDQAQVERHYERDELLQKIRDGLTQLGQTPRTVTLDDLAAVDQFHIGGGAATGHFLDQLAIAAGDRVLDIGCGIGGASRFAAATYGCQVIGVDLTSSFVETGNELCSWVGLQDCVQLVQGNALALDFPDHSFDKAFVLHVGMNIADKRCFVKEASRVLKPGGVFGIYDVMRMDTADLIYPVPWATDAQSSAVASPDEYRKALEAAGFEIDTVCDCHDFALAFFERLRVQTASSEGPPPLGLHLLMGDDASKKVRNMIDNIAHGTVSPVEILARKSGPDRS